MTQQYLVNDLYPCLQGEGVMAGTPMHLLRLHGCGVGCPWCDTKETWVIDPAHEVAQLGDALGTTPRWARLAPWDIVAALRELPAGPEWVLLTGGEPADQDLAPLVHTLRTAGYRVALETSGTAPGHIGAGCDWVCVSPKINMPGGRTILPEALAEANEIKMVIGKAADLAALDALLAAHPPRAGVVVCLQPVSQSARATELCVATAMARGWRLSLQLHKYLGAR